MNEFRASDCKASELTSHIADGRKREKARQHIASFLADLACIGSYGDGGCAVDDGRLDGVQPTTMDAIQKRENNKLGTLRKNNLLTDVEVATTEVAVDLRAPDINAKGRFGYTQLHIAAVNNDIEAAKALLAMGANKEITDRSTATPYEKALNRGYNELAELLKP
jgi:ankyrin repeat protein